MKCLYKVNNGTVPSATKGTLDAITDFKEWLEWLQLLEQDLQASHAAWVSCATKASNVLHDSSMPNIDGAMTTSAIPMSTSAVLYTAPLKPLTDNKKTLLRQHLRCYKCHVFYAGHLRHNCMNPCSTLEDCKKVTPANEAKAKAMYNRIQALSQAMSTTIAAIFKADAVFEESRSNGDSEDFVDVNKVDEYVTSPFTFPQHLH